MTSRSEPLAGRRVLVVGGRGFVGSHVVAALTAAGAAVHLFGPAMPDRMAAVPEGLAGNSSLLHPEVLREAKPRRTHEEHSDSSSRPGSEAVGETIGSIEDGAAIRRAFAASGATDLVSCAGYGAGRLGLMRSGEQDRDAAMAINVLGHDRLLEGAAAHGIRRVVWTSSTVVYGPAALYGLGRVDETAERAPETVYGLTKVLAEDVSAFRARRHAMSVVGLRLPLVLGPGLWYQGAAAALVDFFAAIRRGGPARLSFHDASIDLIHVADVGQAILDCLAGEPRSGSYNLEGFTARAGQLVGDVRTLAPGLVVAFDPAEAPPTLLPLVSGERLRAEVGFTPRHDRLSFVRAMLSQDAP